MKSTNYILDRIKNSFSSSSEDESKGFDDMNYTVGNTSGLDIGNVPSPLDQRIGRMAQIGGSMMEVQITNPATFQIDRPEVMNVINQLGLDITLHGDPNMGFTAAYATGGRVTGYNIAHRYFKRYLEQMASFKYQVQQDQENEFEVGYVNMHASNEMIPALEERMASDVSVDPFGELITSVNGDKKPNIYRNKKFLKKFYDFWFLAKVENPHRHYEQTFSIMSQKFQEVWNKAKEKAADEKFKALPDDEIIPVMQTAIGVDQGLEKKYLDSLDTELPNTIVVQGGPDKEKLRQDIMERQGKDEADQVVQERVDQEYNQQKIEIRLETLEDLSNLQASRRRLLNNPSTIPRDLYELEQGPEGDISHPDIGDPRRELSDFERKTQRELRAKLQSEHSNIKKTIQKVLKDIWKDASADARRRALLQNVGLGRNEIEEMAADQKQVKDAARKAISGEEEMYEEYYVKDDKNQKKPKYMEILERLTQGRLEDEFNKESSIYFHIMPAWMMNSEYSADEEERHPGWEAPKFIWDNIVGESDFEDHKEFRKWLSEKRERQLNVIAAVGACYIWGHFTQNENTFERGVFNQPFIPDFNEWEEGKGGAENEGELTETWIEWMNRFNLKVNLEAMYGSPGELRRVWRPKDIAIACRAINMTADNELDNYNENLVKFTIDMEHTASYGVDPVREMKALADQEEELAEEMKNIDESKPLADVVKTYHLTKPGWEQQQGHRHGPFTRGDKTLYEWLYYLVEHGFARDPEDVGIVMFEVGGEYREEMYVIRIAMNMIELGIKPEDVKAERVDPDGEYESREEALIARFFGMDRPSYEREWAKIEEHAFDPLKGMLEAEQFDHTYSSKAALQNDMRPGEWQQEEYR